MGKENETRFVNESTRQEAKQAVLEAERFLREKYYQHNPPIRQVHPLRDALVIFAGVILAISVLAQKPVNPLGIKTSQFNLPEPSSLLKDPIREIYRRLGIDP